MIGIVLWSEATAGKAVIWCEDQGDLAFYSHDDASEAFNVHTGDWVAFSLELKADLRLAHNIQVLQEPGCPHLAQDLVTASEKDDVVSPLALVGTSARGDCEDRLQTSHAGAKPETGQANPAVPLRADSAALEKVSEGLSVMEGLGSVPAEGATANVIAFPVDKSGGLRRA